MKVSLEVTKSKMAQQMAIAHRKTAYRPVMRPPAQRHFNAGSVTRNTADFNPGTVTGDAALVSHITFLRDRARDLERNNDYVRRFLSALENNVLGSEGMVLQMKLRGGPDGTFRTRINRQIENAWRVWGENPNCTLDQDDEWADVEKIVLRRAAADGGIFIRCHQGSDLNRFGFAVQLMEIDMLDIQYRDILPNGNVVHMGIERDGRRRVVAYWFRLKHPGAVAPSMPIFTTRERVPASELVHYFIKERPTQSIGFPWFVSPMTRLHHLEQYVESEQIAARAGAEKGGWFQDQRGLSFDGSGTEIETDVDGNKTESTVLDFEPNSFDELPPGKEFIPYNPNHPNNSFGDFVSSALHGIAMGMDIDYPTLTGDLSKSNYSSMRSGKLEAQETWKKIQGHFIRKLNKRVFSKWLEMAILSGNLGGLAISRFEEYNRPRFRGRRWPWVDPKVDVAAAKEAVAAGFKSHTDVIQEQLGGDRDDTFQQIAEDNKAAEALGLSFELGKLTAGKPAQPPREPGDQDDDDDDDTDE